jgi:hypothetical protein
MVENFRNFETGPDPFGRSWKIAFLWQQNAISIRHADTIDTKWILECDGEKQEKVVALPLPLLMKVAEQQSRSITDAWCMKLGGLHLIEMLSSWQDMDKVLVTTSLEELSKYSAIIAESDRQSAAA